MLAKKSTRRRVADEEASAFAGKPQKPKKVKSRISTSDSKPKTPKKEDLTDYYYSKWFTEIPISEINRLDCIWYYKDSAPTFPSYVVGIKDDHYILAKTKAFTYPFCWHLKKADVKTVFRKKKTYEYIAELEAKLTILNQI